MDTSIDVALRRKQKRSSFELWLVKWLVLPCFVIWGIYSLISMGKGRSRCEEMCFTQGYVDVRYIPEGGSEEKCICLSQEEDDIKKRIPKGTRIY